MVILWRAGLRVQEALALTEGDASRHTSSAMPTRSRWHAKGVPLIVIQRQLGHSNLGITSVYLQGIDNAEIIETVHARRAPMVPVSASLGS
jgi:integrase